MIVIKNHANSSAAMREVVASAIDKAHDELRRINMEVTILEQLSRRLTLTLQSADLGKSRSHV